MIQKIKRLYRKLFKNPPKYLLRYKTQIERHGSIYGGWNIIPNSIDKNSIVYSFGIGEDISFDLSLINKFGCKVHAFDPTPRVKEWVYGLNTPKEFIYHPIALSNSNGKLIFYGPKDANNVSHSIFSNQNSKAVEVECKDLKTINEILGVEKIDLLKMDIEGFEYGVIDNLIDDKIRINQLLIEFHHAFPEFGNKKTEEIIIKLDKFGFKLFSVSDNFCEYSFILRVN